MSLMEVTVTRKHGSNDQYEIGNKTIIDDQSALPEGNNAEYKTRHQPYNARETPIEYLFYKGEIAVDHRAAADRFRETCEASRMSGGVIDPGALRVDQHMSISAKPHAIDAARNLAQIQGKIGLADFELLVQSCTVGRSVTEIAELAFRNAVDKNDKTYLGRRIRDALVTVAEHFCLSGKKDDGPRRENSWKSRHSSLTGCTDFEKNTQDRRRT